MEHRVGVVAAHAQQLRLYVITQIHQSVLHLFRGCCGIGIAARGPQQLQVAQSTAHQNERPCLVRCVVGNECRHVGVVVVVIVVGQLNKLRLVGLALQAHVVGIAARLQEPLVCTVVEAFRCRLGFYAVAHVVEIHAIHLQVVALRTGEVDVVAVERILVHLVGNVDVVESSDGSFRRSAGSI